jgi:hypothetical protein
MKVFLAVIATMIAVAAFAVVPPTMTYQGIFMDAEGNVMPDGDYVVGFHIFGGPGGGPPDWTEYDTIHVENGLFEVVLGQSVPMNPAFIRPTGTWLGLTYNQQFLEPRQPMNTVAYSFRTCWADSAFGAATLGIHTPESITANQDSVRECLDTLKAEMDTVQACLDTVKADIDTLQERVTELEEGGGGGEQTGTGAFRDSVLVNDATGYDGLFIETDPFTMTGDGVLYFAQVATHDPDADYLYGRVNLVRSSDDVVVSSSITMKVIAGTDLNGGTDLHLQSIAPNAGPDEYYLRAVLWTASEEEFVDITVIDFGAMWVPQQPER